MKKRLAIVIGVLMLAAIAIFYSRVGHHHKVQRAFYYWKSVYSVDAEEQQLLDKLQVKKIYVKYFDVTWNTSSNQPAPVATINFSSAVDTTTEIIPVIFIVNDVFKKCNTQQVDQLATDVTSLLKEINDVNKIAANEIQFDCDWSDATGANYFLFLKKVKAKFDDGIFLSATIRLHQIKYYKRTGIPPVERGMLMFYNMGELKNPLTVNSVFDEQVAAKYIDHVKSYPLSLDFALPIFTWGVHIRNNKVIGLINNLAHDDFSTIKQLKSIKPGLVSNSEGERLGVRLMVQEGFFLHGDYFLKDDVIRIEEITPALALRAAGILSSETNNHDFTVSLFHLDSSNIKRYAIKDFENIYNSFY